MFKQIKGIPMSGNASPLITDLFLANLKEFRYMDKLVSSKSPENLRMAKKLSNNSRCIDDIVVCNRLWSRSRSRRESEVFGWSRSRNLKSRSRSRNF